MLRDAFDHGVQENSASQLFRDGRREPIVALGDPIHARFPGCLARRELVDQRDQRQVLGIGEEESSQAPHCGGKTRVRPYSREPFGN
jgi:hypothetical protein